ncbi:MAG: DUF1566 domain-containing protein [Treponema sp.]|jgi:TolB-like protein|nr:DUF1566 domain-containing protein [Treponema sp.]
MKKINIFGLLGFICLFAGCGSGAEPAKSNSPDHQPPSASAPTTPPKPVYFTGDGGKGFTLAVLEPTGKELTDAEHYLLPLVQGSITGDFNKYSAMTIIDRQNLDKILVEQSQSLSGDYSEADYISIGHLTNARYILSGSITKTASNYILELSISDAESGERKASYPPKPVSSLVLENLSAVKEATADLLAQLGVQLTDAGKQELSATVNTASVNAETALSKALTAQKNGTVVEALSYYYQAVNYDPSLAEAASRLNVLSANISSGNMGADVRNDIQWRKDWVARLTEAEQYFANHMKEPPYTLVYSTDLKQGNVNYEKETVDITGIKIYLISNRSWFAVPENVINQVRKGLEATGRTKDWGLNWPSKSVSSTSPFVRRNETFNVSVELLNENGKVIGRQNAMLPYGWQLGSSSSSLVITLIEDSNKNVTFSGVKADDITDKLNFEIAGINGVPTQIASQNKRISIMPIDEYTKNDVRYKIGDRGPAGGIVFADQYLYFNGWRYLEAAPKDGEKELDYDAVDVIDAIWQLFFTAPVEKELDWYDAIAYCDSLNIGEYTDWRLPNKDELNRMYENLHRRGLGNFQKSDYWSSSSQATGAWYQGFVTGKQNADSKSTKHCVRVVRAF